MKVGICILLNVIVFNISGQTGIPWFNPSSNQDVLEDIYGQEDCILDKEGLDEKLGVEIKEFKPRPFFIHTQAQFKKWMKDKYLMECEANIYKADKTSFLILNFKINSENAKHAYGKLEKGSQIKVTFLNKEHVYMENIERDRGKATRSKKYTTYKGIYPLDGTDVKELTKNPIEKIGIVWEEGYQEYEVQNTDLLMNQMHCLKEK